MKQLKFGFADRIITPLHPTRFYLDGYGFRSAPAESIRDDLHAKVLAIVDGNTTFLIFSLDLIGLRALTYRLICDQICTMTGIPKERIALSCIHTHSAPATGLLDGLPIDVDYFSYVGECCGRAALSAIERACEGSFDAAILPEEIITSYNRRKERNVIDRSIRAAAFRDSEGKLRGVICSASCHAVANKEYTISADWLCELNAISSDDVPYMYFQNRGADIDPPFHLGLPTDELISRLGRELSIPVEKFAMESTAKTSLCGDVRCVYETVTIPMKQFEDTDALRESIASFTEAYLSLPITDHQKHYKLRQLEWYRHMLRNVLSGKGNNISVPLQYIAIGKELVFLFVPFETLTLTGNKLEDIFADAGFKRPSIYVCAYSNITEGYLAPEEEFPFGGYEVSGASHWYNISDTVPESERTVVEWFKKQARILKNEMEKN